MALIVEDGTGLATAEAYISVSDADSYFALIGTDAAWTAASTTEKEQALRLGAIYLDGNFRWQGVRATSEQAKDWPRWDVERDGIVLETDVVPTEVGRANAEAALQHILSSGALFADQARPGGIRSESFTVGEISENVVYDGSASQQKLFARLEALLEGLLGRGRVERS